MDSQTSEGFEWGGFQAESVEWNTRGQPRLLESRVEDQGSAVAAREGEAAKALEADDDGGAQATGSQGPDEAVGPLFNGAMERGEACGIEVKNPRGVGHGFDPGGIAAQESEEL